MRNSILAMTIWFTFWIGGTASASMTFGLVAESGTDVLGELVLNYIVADGLDQAASEFESFESTTSDAFTSGLAIAQIYASTRLSFENFDSSSVPVGSLLRNPSLLAARWFDEMVVAAYPFPRKR